MSIWKNVIEPDYLCQFTLNNIEREGLENRLAKEAQKMSEEGVKHSRVSWDEYTMPGDVVYLVEGWKTKIRPEQQGFPRFAFKANLGLGR
jgi:hypothetical protein